MKRIFQAAAIVATGTAMAVMAGGVAANAAGSNSISGSSTPTWYTSTSLRHVTTANDTIKVGLHHFPAGLSWELVNSKNGAIFAGPVPINTTNWVVVATGVLNGTTFYNRFKSTTSGNFDGNEYY